MSIETKFNVNDGVYFMLNNKIAYGVIIGILITIGDDKYKEKYTYQFPRYNIHIVNQQTYSAYPESSLFLNREDLLKSL